ncbi:MAG: RsmE family RNA methyltransferase, partial [Acidimicrobiales bacterium]
MSLEDLARRVGALTQLRVDDPARPALTIDQDHHLRRVLRARPGEEVVVTDGRGAWAMCLVTDEGLDLVGEPARDPAPAPTALYLAMVRGERGEWAVAKATEVGVARVVPLASARTETPRSGERTSKLVARWR